MCILFVAIEQHEQYPLIIAANRDEFVVRPTLPSHFWGASQQILSGIDQQAGGTWMGINRGGHLAALTNIRAPERLNENAISRGKLVSQYLQSPTVDYELELQHSQFDYKGYNLLFGPWHQLKVYNNHLNQTSNLTKGFYGLSNAELNSPWPKINKGLAQLKAYCSQGELISHDVRQNILFDLLCDPSQALDNELPNTGVPLEWERRLSSIFIQGEEYGTRSSTILKIDTKQQVTWSERSYDNKAKCIAEQNYQFKLN
jgi:uncharacterized protein with NRDE domain